MPMSCADICAAHLRSAGLQILQAGSVDLVYLEHTGSVPEPRRLRCLHCILCSTPPLLQRLPGDQLPANSPDHWALIVLS